MEWIDSLFFEHSAIQAIVVLSLVTAAGLWLGKDARVGNILGSQLCILRWHSGRAPRHFTGCRHAQLCRKFRARAFRLCLRIAGRSRFLQFLVARRNQTEPIEPRSNLHRNGHDRTSKLWPVYSLAGHGGPSCAEPPRIHRHSGRPNRP